MCISGHKSVESLKLYERTTEDEKEQMSDCIKNSIFKKHDLKDSDISEGCCQPSSSISPADKNDFNEFDDFDLFLSSKEVQDSLDAIQTAASIKQPIQPQQPQQPNQHIYNFYGPVIIKQ